MQESDQPRIAVDDRRADAFAVIWGAVVDEDDLDGPAGERAADAVDDRMDGRTAVVNRNDKRQLNRRAHRGFPSRRGGRIRARGQPRSGWHSEAWSNPDLDHLPVW